MVDRIGQQFGDCRLVRWLGRGSFGNVYLAEHTYDGSQVAIKVLNIRLTKSDELRTFLNEARTIHLRHSHIMPLLDFGLSREDTPFLVMEYAPKGTLRDRHPKGSIVPLPTVVSYVNQLTSALQYAHERRIIHRDIKAENMLLDQFSNVLLSDFCIAPIAQSTPNQSTQDVMGTVAYMSPEQIQGKPRPASDQYSLGVVVYEWLSGTCPFEGSFTELCARHMSTSPPPLREKVPTISPEVEQVVMTALAKDPQQRFGSVQAFAMALEQAFKYSADGGELDAERANPEDFLHPLPDSQKDGNSSLENKHPGRSEHSPTYMSPALAKNLTVEFPSALASPLSIPLPPRTRRLQHHVKRTKWVWIVSLIFLVVVSLILSTSTIYLMPPSHSIPRDLGSPDLHLDLKYAKKMQLNQPYIVNVVLSSSKGNVPLSAVSGSLVDGQSLPLRVLLEKGLLGQQNTLCAGAELIVDQTAFRVQPPQRQYDSLEQSQITWMWSVTPLRSDLQMPQEIPVSILFAAKSSCESSDALTGPYPLAGNSSLRLTVEDPASPPMQETPFGLFLLLSGLSLLLLAFLVWSSIALWRGRRKRGRYPMRVPQAALIQDASLQLEKKEKRLSSTTVRASLSIFYCYAHEDKALRDQIEKYLSSLHRSGQIISWHDGEIGPGNEWKQEIDKHLDQADIILLLVSQDFIASDYCYETEMMRALERHRRGETCVIPIILRPTHWEVTPFGKLQALPAGGKPITLWTNQDDAFLNVAKDIHIVVEKLTRESSLG